MKIAYADRQVGRLKTYVCVRCDQCTIHPTVSSCGIWSQSQLLLGGVDVPQKTRGGQ